MSNSRDTTEVESAEVEVDFTERVIRVIESIPEGSVLTYGDVAAIAGSRGARRVGQILALYGHALPWWRVIRSDGSLLRGFEVEALAHYEAENTPLRGHPNRQRVDLRKARQAAAQDF